MRTRALTLIVGLIVACASACGATDDLLGAPAVAGTSNLPGSDAPGGPLPGGSSEDEQFPADLVGAYTGPDMRVLTNPILNYRQLRARVTRVFADSGIGGDTGVYFTAKLGLLGGADFSTRFVETRGITADYLLALDAIAKDACARAVANKTGPFAGESPATVSGDGESALIGRIFPRMLFRAATPSELTSTKAFITELATLSDRTSAWAGACEVLVRHPDSIFSRAPSYAAANADDKARLALTKVANDLVARPPTDDEFKTLAGKPLSELATYFMGLPEFRDYMFHRARVRMESTGTPESDEPARMFALLAQSGAPLQELLVGDYAVDANFQKVARPEVHGKSGVLTMKGFLRNKPGLPHYNYPARVFGDFLGQTFQLTAAIVDLRADATVESTVTPGSTCAGCHQYLTPLAYQRLRWGDDGVYRERDSAGSIIDDSDRGVVEGYRFKGKGIAAFAEQAIRKEGFLRASFQTMVAMLYGRPMRYKEDERALYRQLWSASFEHKGDLRELIKVIINSPGYLES
jgi:hypothetical protein